MVLKNKIQFSFFIVILFIALLLGAYTYNSSKSALENEAYTYLASINQQKNARIDLWVENGANQLVVLAKMPVFKKDFLLGVLYNTNPLPNTEYKGRKRVIEEHLIPALAGDLFTELFVLNLPAGMVVMSTNQRQEGKILKNRPFFMEGILDTHIATPFYSMSIRQPTMLISTPIKDQDGITCAVLVGRLNLEMLSRIMEDRTDLRVSEDTYLVNDQNFFLTEPLYGNNYALRKTVYSNGVQDALDGNSGISRYNDYREKPVIGAYTYLEKYRFALITEIDQQEFLEPINELKNLIIKTVAAASLISLILGWVVSEMLFAPTRKLTKAVEEIHSDNLVFTNPLDGQDDMSKLALTFELITTELENTLVSKQSLEEEVARRKEAEDELNITLEKLKRSNKELERFAYVASHDLQEPLRMVASFTQLLEERYRDKLDDKGIKYIDYAVSGATRMQVLIQDLLTLSRITTQGKEFKRVDSQKLVQQVLEALAVQVTESGANVTVDPLPEVYGDTVQLVQLFQNIISNGIKFCRNEAPQIHISAERAQGKCRFSIRDNGIGIEEKYKEKIFVIFQRLHTQTEYPGTGIGLALCKRIVDRHKGQVWFDSALGKGTTFFFTLDCYEGEIAAEYKPDIPSV